MNNHNHSLNVLQINQSDIKGGAAIAHQLNPIHKVTSQRTNFVILQQHETTL
ncbi:MAG: hypothetical protein ACXITR_07100 [Cyanobacterium sp.]